MGPHYLNRILSARSIALIGASNQPGSVGSTIFQNLLAMGYEGELYAVNPKYKKIHGRKSYPAVGAIDRNLDLAVIATPAESVPGLIRECGKAGVHGAIVMSAGFGEEGPGGNRLQDAMLEAARESGLRIIGPNCLGIMRPSRKINATFSRNSALPGHLALVSQSGAICSAILDWAEDQRIGFSLVASLGDAADVDFGDFLDFLALDPETRSILLYVEGIRDARGFMSGLRAAARMKPVIVIKSGRHRRGLTRGDVPHRSASWALTTSSTRRWNAPAQCARRRSNRCSRLRAFSPVACACARQPARDRHQRRRPRGDGHRSGRGTRPGHGRTAARRYDEASGCRTSHALVAGATPWICWVTLMPNVMLLQWQTCLEDPGDRWGTGDADPPGHDRSGCCRGGRDSQRRQRVVQQQAGAWPAGWAASGSKRHARAIHRGERVCRSFITPEASVEAFAYLTAHQRNQRLLLQVPGPLSDRSPRGYRGRANDHRGRTRARGAARWAPWSPRRCWPPFAFPSPRPYRPTAPARRWSPPVRIGYPLAMKIASPDITHKSDVGGVRLNITTAESVRKSFQVMMQEAAEAQARGASGGCDAGAHVPQPLWPGTDGRGAARPGVRTGDQLRLRAVPRWRFCRTGRWHCRH
jgi:acetyltransferase